MYVVFSAYVYLWDLWYCYFFSFTFTGACANEIIPSINRSLVYKAKEGRLVRIQISPPMD